MASRLMTVGSQATGAMQTPRWRSSMEPIWRATTASLSWDSAMQRLHRLQQRAPFSSALLSHATAVTATPLHKVLVWSSAARCSPPSHGFGATFANIHHVHTTAAPLTAHGIDVDDVVSVAINPLASPEVATQLPGITLDMLNAIGEGAVARDMDMPFENRTKEIATMAYRLAQNMLWLRIPGAQVNLRPVRLLVSSQMFGSGKTAMGMQFIAQLGKLTNADIARLVGQKLSPDVEEELNHLRSASVVSFDIRGCHSVQVLLNELAEALGLGSRASAGSNMRLVLDEWRAEGQGAKHLFINFDEAGVVSAEVMDGLRDEISEVLKHFCKAYQSDPSTPRTHVYLTGRGGSLMPLGSGGSFIGTERIILQQLLPEYVGNIREELTKVSGLVLHKGDGGLPRGLHHEFDSQVQMATAGIPRLILYTLRALHHLRAKHPDKVRLDSKDGIAAALLQAYTQLQFHGIIKREAALPHNSEHLLPWLWLQLVAKHDIWVPADLLLPSDAGQVELDRLLAHVPVFVAKQSPDGRLIKLARSGFAELAAASAISDGKFVWSHGCATWQGFEEVVQAALRFMVALGYHAKQTWADTMFFLNHPDVPEAVKTELVPGVGVENQLLAKRAMLAHTRKLMKMNTDAKLTTKQLCQLKDVLGSPLGTVVHMTANSSSPDVGVIAKCFNLYLQCKFSSPSANKLSVMDAGVLVAEVEKSIKMGDAAPDKHNILVFCVTQALNKDVQALLEPHPDGSGRTMAVLTKDKCKVGEKSLAVPANWTVIILDMASSKELQNHGAAASLFEIQQKSLAGTKHL